MAGIIRDSFYDGLSRLRRRPELAGLLYAVNLLVGLALSVPAYRALRRATGNAGFGGEMARHFDLVLWVDVLDKVGLFLAGLGWHLLWMVPLYALWKVAAGVGLVHALRGTAEDSFWQGMRRFTGRGLLLALFFVLMLAGWLLVVILVVFALSSVWDGEVGLFWTNAVILPALFTAGVLLLDLMHDYSCIALVVDRQKVLHALYVGLRWPFSYVRAGGVYLLWAAPAALLMVLPFVLDMTLTAGTAASIWMLFLAQQFVLLLRAAATAGWLGSEIAFYERIRPRPASHPAGKAAFQPPSQDALSPRPAEP